MARCGCADPLAVDGECGCSVVAGPSGNVTVTGTGTAVDPFTVDATTTSNALVVEPGEGLTLSGAGTPASPWSLGTDPAFFSRGFQSMQVFTASGSFDKTAFPLAKWIRVRAVGGGGGGAGASAGAGVGVARAGGAGGSYAESWLNVSTLAAVTPVTVGAGGAFGVAANGAGSNGGSSSFGALVVAPGGIGSDASTTPTAGWLGSIPGVNTTLGTGQITSLGQPGFPGFQVTAGNGTGGAGGMSGHGFGAGGRGPVANNIPGGSGRNAVQYGGGGGGALASEAGAFDGGQGGPGLVTIEIFG